VAVLTGDDPAVIRHRLRAKSVLPSYVETEHPALAWPRVRYCGEAVAAVVGTDRYTVEDATLLVQVDDAPLPATVDALEAMRAGAPALHAEAL